MILITGNTPTGENEIIWGHFDNSSVVRLLYSSPLWGNICSTQVNPLRPSDTICRYRSRPALIQVMVCCLATPITRTNVDLSSKVFCVIHL